MVHRFMSAAMMPTPDATSEISSFEWFSLALLAMRTGAGRGQICLGEEDPLACMSLPDVPDRFRSPIFEDRITEPVASGAPNLGTRFLRWLLLVGAVGLSMLPALPVVWWTGPSW